MENILTVCDREPIHLPGAIQEFGAIAVVEVSSLKIVQASANAHLYFGFEASAMLGKTISDLFSDRLALSIAQKQKRVEFGQWCANVWYQEKLVLIEAEKNTKVSTVRLESTALDQIQKTDSLTELLETTAHAIQDLTKLDRVMIYRFHEDLHGEVVAEAVKPNVESYLGLHYPANDIPAPARMVFLKNWVRMIPKVNYTPVAILPRDNPVTRAPLDLGSSLLRAVSPVHIEYLQNMGVGASLTISLIVQGKLWGLIACHHLSEHLISSDVRDACEVIGRMSSAYIATRMESDLNEAKERFRTVHRKLVERLHPGVDMATELTNYTPNLLDLISSTGSAAALYLDGYWVRSGNAPSESELEKLISWLEKNHAGEAIFATEALPAECEVAKDFKPEHCGMLALYIPKTTRNYILWFRPELRTTLSWAGKPEKIEDARGRLHPRGSFELWNEEIKGRSLQWTDLEKLAALELRNAILAVDLQKQYQKEQEARREAERATLAREELMAVLSHDLKNPLGSIRLGSQFATRFLTPDSFEKVRPYLARIEKSTASMDALISDILSITKLEAGHQTLERELASINAIIMDVVELVTPIASEKRITLEANLKVSPCDVSCDRGQMFQVISNILGNAIKFTPENGKISIVLESCGPDSVKVAITDTGPGIPKEHLSNIFDRFWQAQQTKRFGTGLGLAIVKGIVKAHDGQVWAESDGKLGTTFHITLPYLRGIDERTLRT